LIAGHPGGFAIPWATFRPTLAVILYHIILWVKKIITQHIVVLSEMRPEPGTYLRDSTLFFVTPDRGYLN
jgi:hypothetical protein